MELVKSTTQLMPNPSAPGHSMPEGRRDNEPLITAFQRMRAKYAYLETVAARLEGLTVPPKVLAHIRRVIRNVNRQRPFGRKDWQAQIAMRFGLASALRARGRRRIEKKSSCSPF